MPIIGGFINYTDKIVDFLWYTETKPEAICAEMRLVNAFRAFIRRFFV